MSAPDKIEMPDTLVECQKELEYWHGRCRIDEERLDLFEQEIMRLNGFRPLTEEQIAEHNRMVEALNKSSAPVHQCECTFSDPVDAIATQRVG